MREKLKYVLLPAVALGLASVWLFLQSRPEPLLAGRSVEYWLNHTPTTVSSLPPADHPLAQAGLENIPALTNAITRDYPNHPFLHGLRRYVPAFLNKYLPPPKPPAGVIRQNAAYRLGLMGPAASNAVPVLVDLLNRPQKDYGNKARIIQALGFIGPPARPAVPLLVKNLGDSNKFIRMNAVDALIQIGTVPPQAIPILKTNLNDNSYVAAKMAVALWYAQPTPESLSRVKTMLALTSSVHIPAQAAATLGYLPKLPDELKPQLTHLLDSSDPNIRQGAAIALAQPHAENLSRIIPILLEGLQQGLFQIRCAQALGKIGPEAAAARPDLEHAPGYDLGIVARAALAKIVNPATNQVDAADNHPEP